MDESAADLEIITKELLNESKECSYPSSKKDIRQRYRNAAYEIHKKSLDHDPRRNFLSFGSRRSSTVSNYGNTPIIMRRSVSSNGELVPYQGSHFGSLRGAPAGLAEQESKYSAQFGSLRGLPTTAASKRLSKFDETEEELELRGRNDENGTMNCSEPDEDRLSCATDGRSHDSWDTASVDAATSRATGSTKPKGRKGGLFRRAVKDERHNEKDKWRDDSVGTSQKKDSKINGKDTKIDDLKKINEAHKSSESLVSVKRKKHWWFRRKKAGNDSDAVREVSEQGSTEAASETLSFNERASLGDKASSDMNLKMQAPEDNRSLHEELRRSQIHLKGYSQRTVAGMNLNNRHSGTNQSVTSRGSLTGSDLLISDSSKSFMQYDLPRTRDQPSKCSNSSMADRIREGKTYEEQFETSLHRADSSSNNSTELVDKRQGCRQSSKSSKHHGIVGVDIDTSEQTFLEGASQRHLDNTSHHAPATENNSVCIDVASGAVSPGRKVSIDSVLDQLQETDVDDTARSGCRTPVGETGRDGRHVLLQLSPDSRPIRPLHCSTSIPTPLSPPHNVHHLVRHTPSLPGHEAYPHSLLDRPASSRLATKRLSATAAELLDEQESAEATTKKSNIAYTLTFQNEPICVNLRVKSQSVTPEPYSTSISHNGSAEGRKSFPIDKEESGGSTVAFERQYSGGDDRETSPGYRLAYASGPMRSPTPPRKSLRKNPKVVREKDRLALGSISSSSSGPQQQQSAADEVTEYRSALSSPVNLLPDIDRLNKQNEDNTAVAGVAPDADTNNAIPVVTNFKDVDNVNPNRIESNETHTSIERNVFTFETASDNVRNEEAVGTVEEKPTCKLQRRNTFTLPNKKEPDSNEHSGEDKENQGDTSNITASHSNGTTSDGYKLVIDGAIQQSILSSKTTSPDDPRGPSPVWDPQDEATSGGDLRSPGGSRDSPNLNKSAAGGGSRIPVRRGGPPEGRTGGSRIPTITSTPINISGVATPLLPGTPERSSTRKKKTSVTSGIPNISGLRKGSIVDPAVAAKLGVAATSPTATAGGPTVARDNSFVMSDNKLVVKRETILQIAPEATSTVCSVM